MQSTWFEFESYFSHEVLGLGLMVSPSEWSMVSRYSRDVSQADKDGWRYGRLRSGCVQGCGSSAGKAHGEDEDGLLNPFHPFFRSYTVVYQAFLQDRNAMEVGFARHECGVTRWGAQLVTQVGMIGPSAETSASNKLPSNK